MPYFSRHAIIDNCVCQVGKGMHFALKRFECALKKFTVKHKQNGYVLKCDILKYFPSIPHKQILEILKKHIKDKKILKLMEDIIDSFHTDISYLNKYNILPLYQNDNMLKTNRGLPIGNQTSQILGMFYLDSVDRYIKEKLKIKIYSRYMDDFILVHENFEVLKNALCIIKQLTQKLGLSLNSKTQIFPLKNGVTYLGFRYYVQKNGKVLKFVAKKTISRFKARAKLLNKAYFDGAINNQRVLQSVIAYHGHLAHGNCYWLERGLIKKIKVPLKSEIESSKKIKKMFLKVKHS